MREAARTSRAARCKPAVILSGGNWCSSATRPRTKHEIALAPIGEIDTLENVAMPLQHGGRTVGTLLLRLRESFDQSDRRLLAAVGGQLARDLQREDAQRKKLDSNLPAFISARTSGHRLHAFDLISGVLTEHRFGAQVLAEASDGYAIAYLDGTIAYVNPAMLWAARMNNHDASEDRSVRPAGQIQIRRF